MSNGTSNRTALRYIAEVTAGVTPTTPAFKNIRYTGESLNFDRTSVQSKEIRSDRNTADLVPVKAKSGGDIEIELSATSFDDFIEAALCGTWGAPASGVSTLKNGTTNRSFTIQKHFQDLSPNVYTNFVGQRVSDMSLDFKVGSILTGKFGFMGTGVSSSNTQIASATVTASPSTTPMNAVSNLINIQENGTTSTMAFKSLSLNVNNNMREQEAIGHLFAVDIVPGTFEIGGALEVYFSDLTMYNRFVNDTAFSYSFKTQDADGNYYVFTLPRIKIESSKVESGGLDTDIMLSANWKALYDSTAACMIQIDKFASS